MYLISMYKVGSMCLYLLHNNHFTETNIMVTQVLIDGVPPEFVNTGFQYYIQKLTNGKIACKVTLYGNRIAAEFQQPVGKLC